MPLISGLGSVLEPFPFQLMVVHKKAGWSVCLASLEALVQLGASPPPRPASPKRSVLWKLKKEFETPMNTLTFLLSRSGVGEGRKVLSL